MPAVSPEVYNQANLFSWQQELPQVQSQISEKSRVIEEQRQLLSPFQRQLETTKRLISITQSQLTNVNISATQDMLHHMHDHHHDRHHHHHRDGVLHYVGDFAREWSRSQLQTELGRLEAERISIQNQMRPYERVINETNAELTQLKSRKSFLDNHILVGGIFLRTLQENPFELVQTLANRLQKAFIDYEDTHLTGLSPQVRISLIAARYGLGELTRYESGYNPEALQFQSTHRANYLRLCGFIWDLYSRVRQENLDTAFEKTLADLVESTHVLQHGDLPDQWQTNYSANAWFEVSKNANLGVFAIQPGQLDNIEEQIFNDKLGHLKRNNVLSNNIQRHIMNAAELIEAEVAMKKQKHEYIDYHFYGRTVCVLTDALNNPNDLQAVKRLGDIAEFASGSPSVGKQVLGGLLIALGVLLIGASIAGLVTTFGSSSALSAVGITLGLSLLQTQVVLGVTSTIAAATGIGLTFFTGPNTLKSGQRQGLSQGLIDVKEDIEHSVTYH
ncbi:hypothetical protein [Legionella sainthelensi]|uniref:hypothetical protein n=1 Tax=Legionella sainthelensi TaxID=28087 RepID=UPI000E20856F|nr:hypothetical protein [Legionella sainthelensi]